MSVAVPSAIDTLKPLPTAAGKLLMQRIDALAALSENPACLTRRFATAEHRQANDLVASWMRASDMVVHEDAVGNVIGRYAGLIRWHARSTCWSCMCGSSSRSRHAIAQSG